MDKKVDDSKLTSCEERQKQRVTKYNRYAPGTGQNGYRQKICKKLSYCEPFMYFLTNILCAGNLQRFKSFNHILGIIQSYQLKCRFDGCKNLGDFAIGYDPNGFDRRHLGELIKVLKPIFRPPLLRIMLDYSINLVGSCNYHYEAYMNSHENRNYKEILSMEVYEDGYGMKMCQWAIATGSIQERDNY